MLKIHQKNFRNQVMKLVIQFRIQMQYIFLSHDVDWRRQGPPIEHILERKERFDSEIFTNTKPENLYRNIPEYMELEEKFGIRSTFFFRTFYEDGNVDDYEDDILELQKGGWEIGLHTDPQSVNDIERIKQEKEKLESLTKKPIIGNRVHFLNYNLMSQQFLCFLLLEITSLM